LDLVIALVGAQPELEVQGIEAMETIGDARAVAFLEKKLLNKRRDVRMAAAQSMGALPEGGFNLLTNVCLADRDRQVRQAAVWALAQRLDPRAIPVIERALEDRDGDVRQAAALALGVTAGPEAGPSLAAALTDRVSAVRFAAAVALGVTGSQAEAPALLGALRNPDVMTRLGAACGLAFLGMAEGLPVLSEGLRSEVEWHNFAALVGMARLGTPEALREADGRALGGGAELQQLADAVQAGDGARAFARAAGEAGFSSALYAAQALAYFRDPASIPTLEQLCADERAEVRRAARMALRRIRQEGSGAGLEAGSGSR
jgi:HEAT repeat protein